MRRQHKEPKPKIEPRPRVLEAMKTRVGKWSAIRNCWVVVACRSMDGFITGKPDHQDATEQGQSLRYLNLFPRERERSNNHNNEATI